MRRLIAAVLVAGTFVLGLSAIAVSNDNDKVVYNAERER